MTDEKRIVDCWAKAAAKPTQASGGSLKRDMVKVAKAEADGTGLWYASGGEGRSKGGASRVGEDSEAHARDVTEELHQGMTCGKGDAPGAFICEVNHG